jgi:D-alanyl-D-alanine carboxypeptidase
VGCGGSSSPPAAVTPSREFETTARALDRALDTSFENSGAPGMAAAVVSPGGQWSAARGMADVRHHRRVTTGTPFAQGSISKLLVAALAMRLEERGRLRLDAPLSQLIERPPARAGAVPLRRLLNQTSGIGDRPETYEAVARHPSRRWTMAEILSRVAVFQPPGKFAYMDANYQLAGKAIERAARTTVGAALRRDLLGPLGLEDIVLQPEQRPSRLTAHGYDSSLRDLSDGSRYSPYTSWATASWTAGGLVATPQSIARFGDALFNGRVLKPESLRAMVRFGDADYWDGYGLGVARLDVHGHEIWGHGGRIPGFSSQLYHLPREHVTIAVVVNEEDFPVEDTASALVDAVLGSLNR